MNINLLLLMLVTSYTMFCRYVQLTLTKLTERGKSGSSLQRTIKFKKINDGLTTDLAD